MKKIDKYEIQCDKIAATITHIWWQNGGKIKCSTVQTYNEPLKILEVKEKVSTWCRC